MIPRAPGRSEGPRCRLRVAMPDGAALELAVTVSVTGQQLLAQVCALLQVRDSRFFGLGISIRNELVLIEPEMKLAKYCAKQWLREVEKAQAAGRLAPPLTVVFRAQCYVDMAAAIRHWYYALVRGQVRASRCTNAEGTFFSLAALALQYDYGDALGGSGVAAGPPPPGKVSREEPVGRAASPSPRRYDDAAYFEPSDYFPAWVLSRRGVAFARRHAAAAHAELAGMARGRALRLFVLDACRRLADDVPVTRYRLLARVTASVHRRHHRAHRHHQIFDERVNELDKRSDREVILGVSLDGIQIYQGTGKHQGEFLYALPWMNIGKISAQGSRFEVRLEGRAPAGRLSLRAGDPRRASSLLRHARHSHAVHAQLEPLLLRLRRREHDALRYRECFISDYPEPRPAGPPDPVTPPEGDGAPLGAETRRGGGGGAEVTRDDGGEATGDRGVAMHTGHDTRDTCCRLAGDVSPRLLLPAVGRRDAARGRRGVDGATSGRRSFQGFPAVSSHPGQSPRTRSRSLDERRSSILPITTINILPITISTATNIPTTIPTTVPTTTVIIPTTAIATASVVIPTKTAATLTTATVTTAIPSSTAATATTATIVNIITNISKITPSPPVAAARTVLTITTSAISTITFLAETAASPVVPIIARGDPSDLGDPSNHCDPDDPGDPCDPNDPNDPDIRVGPGDLNDPGDPNDPGDSNDPGEPWRSPGSPARRCRGSRSFGGAARRQDSGYHSHCATAQRRRGHHGHAGNGGGGGGEGGGEGGD